jgi:hypothetical protein
MSITKEEFNTLPIKEIFNKLHYYIFGDWDERDESYYSDDKIEELVNCFLEEYNTDYPELNGKETNFVSGSTFKINIIKYEFSYGQLSPREGIIEFKCDNKTRILQIKGYENNDAIRWETWLEVKPTMKNTIIYEGI